MMLCPTPLVKPVVILKKLLLLRYFFCCVQPSSTIGMFMRTPIKKEHLILNRSKNGKAKYPASIPVHLAHIGKV